MKGQQTCLVWFLTHDEVIDCFRQFQLIDDDNRLTQDLYIITTNPGPNVPMKKGRAIISESESPFLVFGGYPERSISLDAYVIKTITHITR